MRRVRQAVTALSLLLFAALAVTWLRSYWRVESASYFQPWSDGSSFVDRDTTFAFSRGRCYFQRGRHDRWPVSGATPPERPPSRAGAWSTWVRRQPDQQFESRTWDRRFAGFAIREEGYRDSDGSPRQNRRGQVTTVRVPAWSVAIVMSLPLILVATGAARRSLVTNRRLAAGLCPGCGYDLRASPGRCPECGTGSGTRKG